MKINAQIVKVADEIIITEFRKETDVSLHASADALIIKDKLLRMNYPGKITVKKDLQKALKQAFSLLVIQQLNNKTIIVVTGSLYLVGEVRAAIFP